jgi:hypothetical protein
LFFLPADDLAKGREFYENALGLAVEFDDPFGNRLDATDYSRSAC